MLTFNDTLYQPVSIVLQGVWKNDNYKFQFITREKTNPHTGDILELVLLIDDVEQGIVTLKFTEEGACYIYLNANKTYRIYDMRNWKDNYNMTLVDSDNNNITFQKLAF